MANALIPTQKNAADPFWLDAARQLFSRGAAVLWKRGETRNRVLLDLLLKTELRELAEAMAGTETQSIVDPENPKTTLSVRAMLTANIGTMDLLSDEGGAFSIREWIEHGGEGSLFLTSRADQHASLRGLISTWLEIAVNSLLSLPRSDDRRVWVILDELPTLHQLPSLKPGLAQGRQYGGCFVLGVQVFSDLRDIYGRDIATSISGLCGTRVVLAAPDRETSEWSAKSLGQIEIESQSEGVSYDTPHGGVTLSTKREERSLVLPSEVSRLQNLSGYIKLPGELPVARIRLNYKRRDRVAERFVPKAEPKAGAGWPQAPADRGESDGAASASDERTSDRTPETDNPAGGAQRNGGDGAPASLGPAAPVAEVSAAAESGEVRRTGSDRGLQDRALRADAGGEGGEEREWLVEEWASAAGPPDGWPGEPQREGVARGGTTVPAGGGGTSAAPGTRGDGGDVDGVSPSAAPGVGEERRPQDEEDEEDGEDRKSWL